MIALLLTLAAGASPRVSLRVDPGLSSVVVDAAGQLGILGNRDRAGSLLHTRTDELVSSGPNASLIERLRFSVIRLQAQVSDRDLLRPWMTVSKEGTFVGSGFVIRNRKDQGPLIVTNAHVVSNANRVTIQVPASGQTSYEARVVMINPSMDIALVELANMKQVEMLVANTGFELNPVPIYRKAARLGEEVMTMGFPLGQTTVKLTKGVISGHEKVGDFMAFQQTAPISPGNSGGPLFSEGTGEVVGINFAAAVGENSQSNNYAIPGWHVDQMLHEYDRSKVPKTTDLASTYNQIACRESHDNCVYHVPRIRATAAEGSASLYERYACKEGFFMARIEKDSIFAAAEPPVVGKSFVISVNGIKLDKYGMARSDHYFDDPILFTDLLFTSRAMGPAEVEVCTCGETKIHKVPISALAHTIQPPKKEAIPEYDEPSLVKFDYEQFGDVTIQPLNTNLLKLLATTGSKRTDLLRFATPNQAATVLVVTDVLHVNKNTGTLAVGDVIEKINGHPVKDLVELRKYFVPQQKKKVVPSFIETPGHCNAAHEMLWTLETSSGKEIAEDWHKALAAQRSNVQRGERPLTPAVRSALKASHTLSMVEESLTQPVMPELSVVEQAVEERTDVRRGGAPLLDLKAITAGMKFF